MIHASWDLIKCDYCNLTDYYYYNGDRSKMWKKAKSDGWLRYKGMHFDTKECLEQYRKSEPFPDIQVYKEEFKMDNLTIKDDIDFLCNEASLRASDLVNAMHIDKNQDYSWQVERLCKYITLIKDLVKEIK